MTTYTITIFTGDHLYAGTNNKVFITLLGDNVQSEEDLFPGNEIDRNSHCTHTLICPESIGDLVVVQLRTQRKLLSNLDWFVDKVEVTSPEGQVYKFPIYHWLKYKNNSDGDENNQNYYFREGTAMRVFEEVYDIAKWTRENDLMHRKIEYVWEKYSDGLPYIIMGENPSDLPSEVQFSPMKNGEFFIAQTIAFATNLLGNFIGRKNSWESFDEIHDAFKKVQHKTTEIISDYVQKHWREDAFFGYQFLNGVNPILIRRCTSLPSNFPVTDDMVTLEGGASLTDEMKDGNIFLCDYKNLDGVETNLIHKKKQYLAAPLVLLHKTPNDELKPIAIQLQQTPAEDNPIFVPTDSEYDWLLAKTFVRGADFIQHELNVHLLRTHLLAEVFTVALLRNVPSVHPLFKLLIPHTRYNLQINVRARQTLLTLGNDSGLFNKAIYLFWWKGCHNRPAEVTYSSLCIPDDVTERGVESVPNYYYRDDGLRLWDIIHRYVNDMIIHYYKSDKEVQDDTELQNYIKDIFEYGFLSNKESGIPQSFSSVKELGKFLTMVVFTSSAQHAAVNHGQLDFGAWMPNFPLTLARPPPTKKGDATEEILLETLPIIDSTVNGLAVLWLLTTEFKDAVPLGQFPSERFIEDGPIDLMNTFEKKLKEFGDDINRRNSTLELPYIYMCPGKVENSVAI